jgi:hypothetical protein
MKNSDRASVLIGWEANKYLTHTHLELLVSARDLELKHLGSLLLPAPVLIELSGAEELRTPGSKLRIATLAWSAGGRVVVAREVELDTGSAPDGACLAMTTAAGWRDATAELLADALPDGVVDNALPVSVPRPALRVVPEGEGPRDDELPLGSLGTVGGKSTLRPKFSVQGREFLPPLADVRVAAVREVFGAPWPTAVPGLLSGRPDAVAACVRLMRRLDGPAPIPPAEYLGELESLYWQGGGAGGEPLLAFPAALGLTTPEQRHLAFRRGCLPADLPERLQTYFGTGPVTAGWEKVSHGEPRWNSGRTQVVLAVQTAEGKPLRWAGLSRLALIFQGVRETDVAAVGVYPGKPRSLTLVTFQKSAGPSPKDAVLDPAGTGRRLDLDPTEMARNSSSSGEDRAKEDSELTIYFTAQPADKAACEAFAVIPPR